MLADLRYALRQLRQAPGFTAVIVLTLALGIGASTTIFSVVDAILLHPYTRMSDPERLVRISHSQLPRNPEIGLSAPVFLEMEKSSTVFDYFTTGRPTALTLTGEGEPIRLNTWRISARILELHGFRIGLGRGFAPEEFEAGRDRVVIMSHAMWQTVFGGDPQAIGRKVQLNGEPYTLVGVRALEPREARDNFDAFVPLVLTDDERANRRARAFPIWARLKPGATFEQGTAEMALLAARLAREFPDTDGDWKILTAGYNERETRELKPVLYTLLGSVAAVLLIACANVANLLLARATSRQREMSVRAALGANRVRLVRQLLTESILLALLGGVAGLLVAHWALQVVHGYAHGAAMARIEFVQLDSWMLLFALGLSVTTGIVFGLAPAWLAASVDLNESLKEGTRGNTETGLRGRLRSGLVVVEVALTLVLLAGAGLLMRSFAQLMERDPGYHGAGVTTLQMRLPDVKYAKRESRIEFLDKVLVGLRALPGVQAAAATDFVPPLAVNLLPFAVPGQTDRPITEWPVATPTNFTPGYLSTMGIRLLRGRDFNERDNLTSPRVLLINETLAKQYFPGENPIGRQLVTNTVGSGPREIVGVVSDVTTGPAGSPILPQIYNPLRQGANVAFHFVVRTSGPAAALPSSLKPQIYAADRDQPIMAIRPLVELMDERMINQRFTLHLLGVFAVIALVIAAVGIYGVVSYTVSQRTTEIGIRMALGAQPGDVLRLILVYGARLVGSGVLLGLVVALAGGRVMESMLFNTSARDPMTLAVITLVLTGMAAIACFIPARRATKVSPMIALRAQ
jgi:putative ABC transport system permease protein